MAILQDVPVEVLTKILTFAMDELEPFEETAFMCALSKLSPQFYFVLQPLIFKKVGLFIKPGSVAYALFLRSLKESPDLVEMVLEMAVGWSEAGKDVHANANELLKVLSGLRTLSIRARWDKDCFSPEYLDVNPMKNLKTIKLWDLQLTMESIQRYLLLDNIELFFYLLSVSWRIARAKRENLATRNLRFGLQFPHPSRVAA